jgi:hypothetical protein
MQQQPIQKHPERMFLIIVITIIISGMRRGKRAAIHGQICTMLDAIAPNSASSKMKSGTVIN